jgi:hypothetical protein
MLYVGYPIEFKTALELTEGLGEFGSSTRSRLQKHGLDLYDIDKGVCIMGVVVEEIHICDKAYQSINDGLMQILIANRKVLDGLRALGVNLSRFQIAPMEEEPIWVENPEPYLISTG